jgi:ABC transporter related protein
MCNSLLQRLGLEKYRKTKAGSLSGGEQQRVALGRALYSKPTILLLDEPLSALDWNLRKHVREDLVSIIREWDVPCVWVTHDESEAEMVGDRHWTCEEGQIQISK